MLIYSQFFSLERLLSEEEVTVLHLPPFLPASPSCLLVFCLKITNQNLVYFYYNCKDARSQYFVQKGTWNVFSFMLFLYLVICFFLSWQDDFILTFLTDPLLGPLTQYICLLPPVFSSITPSQFLLFLPLCLFTMRVWCFCRLPASGVCNEFHRANSYLMDREEPQRFAVLL